MDNTIQKRMIFENAVKAMVKNGRDPREAILTQSFLRFEVPLVVGQTTYRFDTLVNENNQPVYPTNQKLAMQDAFVCAEIGFFLAVPASQTDVAFRLLTYPNITALTAAVAPNYFAVYNGQMNLTVGQKTVITNWDLSRHLVQPVSQQNVINATYASTAAPAILQGHDAADFSTDGFYPVEPNFILSGGQKNDLVVQLPGAGIPTAVTANSRLVCVLRGILAQNVTNVK